jgi:hypothetical protein
MKKPKFSLTKKDGPMAELVDQSNPVVLATWARDCALRVLPYFTSQFPDDPRPQAALDTLQDWIDTGEFHMQVIRSASMNAHAAAREVGEDNPARSAARAADQAAATAHVHTHAPVAALYAQQAIHRASSPEEALERVSKERNWQVNHLIELNTNEN